MYTGTLTIGSTSWAVNIATSSTELAQGLSGTSSLPANTGMLFDLGSERIVTVNAYNMLYNLAVIFFDSNFTVTEVVPLLLPGPASDVTNSIPARYFLEINPDELGVISPLDVGVLSGYEPSQVSSMSLDIGSIIGLMAIVLVLNVVSKAMKGNTKNDTITKKTELPKQKASKETALTVSDEARTQEIEEKRIKYEALGNAMAQEVMEETGEFVIFDHLDPGWQGRWVTPRYWFKNDSDNLLIASDKEELTMKITFKRRYEMK